MSQEYTMHKAFTKFAKEKSQKAYEEFLFKFLMFAKEKGNALVPTEINKQGQMTYGLVQTTDGYYYIVCTHPDELSKCSEESTAVVYLDKFIERMLNDKEVKGICVNPYSDFPCFIPQDYVKQILSGVSDNK